MKFFVTAILLILGPFSFIELVHSIECYVTIDDSTEECKHQIKKQHEKADTPAEKMLSDTFACLRNRAKERKGAYCETACATIIYFLKDKTEWMVKNCDTLCHEYKPDDTLTSGSDFVGNIDCKKCSLDNCNNQKPKSNQRSSSQSAVSTPLAAAVFILVSIVHNILL